MNNSGNDDLDLEEGEIADDSSDGGDVVTKADEAICDDDDDGGGGGGEMGGIAAAGPASLGPNAGVGILTGGPEPQRKRKKVVRIRRKVVKKKVVKKKAGADGKSHAHGNEQLDSASLSLDSSKSFSSGFPKGKVGPLLQPHQMAGYNPAEQSRQKQQQQANQQPIQAHQQQQPQQQQQLMPPQSQLAQQNQNQSQQSVQNTSQPLDTLWEQQVFMLQELQRQQQQQQQQQQQPQLQQVQSQHHTNINNPIPSLPHATEEQMAEILRAAAADEDLRIFPNNMITHNTTGYMNHNDMLQNQQAHLMSQLLPTQMNQPAKPMQQMNMLPQSQLLQQQHMHLIQNNQLTHQAQPQEQIQPNQRPVLVPTLHQTPSSPDDDTGKSSYEAISKMLNLLRNSADVTNDSSEKNEDELENKPEKATTVDDNLDANKTIDSQSKQFNCPSYSLIPILVEGIDYTKYKLLAQYEPKFKNDPRLNQQA